MIAVDWSGRLVGERTSIWLAEAELQGQPTFQHPGSAVVRLEAGRTRAQVIDELCRIAATATAEDPVLIGLDFSFSFPAWWVRDQGCRNVGQLWELAASDGNRWLEGCEAPFWGRPGRPRPADLQQFRLCEQALLPVGGIRPKSTFQIGGAGSVGTGSVRGMALLPQLREHGCSIWPFDPPGPVTVFEMYPRLFTGPVVKSDAQRRTAYLEASFSGIPLALSALGAASEDAFDALICAQTIAAAAALGVTPLQTSMSADPETVALEGWIPLPAPAAPDGTRTSEDGSRVS